MLSIAYLTSNLCGKSQLPFSCGNFDFVFFFFLQTRRWSFGNWLVMRHNTAFHKNVCTVTLTSSVTSFYHPMVTTLCPDRGIRLYACGIWLPEKLLADSKIIPRCEEVFLILFFLRIFENIKLCWWPLSPEWKFLRYADVVPQLQWVGWVKFKYKRAFARQKNFVADCQLYNAPLNGTCKLYNLTIWDFFFIFPFLCTQC